MSSKIITRPWLALLGIGLASFLGCIDFTIVNTALPVLQASLKTSVSQLQWIINIFMLVLSACMVVAGRFADLHGRRKWLYIGMILFGLSSVGAGLSPSINWLILFRLLQGLGVAILYTVPVAIIANSFPEAVRGRATGILIGVNGLGLAAGPLMGGMILSFLSWRWIFFVNVPLIIVSLIICSVTLIESKTDEVGAKIDWMGLILLMIGMPLMVYAVINSNSVLFGVGMAAMIALYFVENKSSSPIIQFKLFANHKFLSALIANFSLAFFYTVLFFLLPFYLHNIHLDSSWDIGLMLLPATAMVAVLSPVVGHMVDSYGPKKMLMIGFSLFIISAIMQLFFGVQTSTVYILIALLLFGIGWAFILSPSIVAAISAIHKNSSGVAMGTIGTLHNFGGAIGLAIGTVVYHYRAKFILLADLAKQNITAGAWTKQIISDPDNAINILSTHANISVAKSTVLFQNFFVQGYNSAIILLLLISLGALLAVMFGIKAESK
ncbi:MAG TPA: MFS transporter [Gammaproteobacteria bacterium]|nr:MFS transporter [Gammaproteobacteria bacterium]